MALFENVNYTYYSSTLGRSEVPNEDAFNKFKLENELKLKRLFDDGLIIERELNGLDNTCCLWIEESYKADQIAAGAGNIDTSESIGGYSHSVNTKAFDIAAEKDAKSTDEKKYKWLGLYCHILSGAR